MKKLYFSLFALVFSLSSMALTIDKVKFSKGSKDGSIKVLYKGVLRGAPELKFDGNKILVSIPHSNLAKNLKEILRKENFSTSNEKDTHIHMTSGSNQTNLALKFPFNIEKHKTSVSMFVKDNYLELNFPKVRVKSSSAVSYAPVQKETKTSIKEMKGRDKKLEEILGEDYLNELISDEKTKVSEKKKTLEHDKASKKSEVTTQIVKSDFKEDKVITSQAATEKKTGSFSMVSYMGKFVAFLGFVLLLFYGLVVLFKKGVFKRSKLGFLNNTKQIEVLSQTHISPKKSLMMVKVHKQIFLLSNTENGMQFLSEINDPMGLVKDGEKIVSGENFDSNLDLQNKDEFIFEKVKLKENILESTPVDDNKKGFREELKNKIKNLKPLQQEL